jgi:RNA-directed DNA polymerase
VQQDGVGQLTFTFFPEEKDGAGEAEAGGPGESQEATLDGPAASPSGAGAGSKPPRKRKHHSLMDKVYAAPNLRAAWERVRANQGAPGGDGMTIERFEERREERLAELAEDLRAKSYRPHPVRRVYIPKSDGGQRPLGIPTVRDRIVQQALLQILEPIFEAKFSNRSHGFRRGRGCTTALEVIDQAVRHGYGWVVDADLRQFFDTVDHEKLLDALNEEVADGSVLRLIRRILTAGVQLPDAAGIEPTELGTPQGGPLSPLLANVYLHRFDEAMVQAGAGLLRYADDFVIFAKSETEAAAALAAARQILEGELGLQLHPEKTQVVTVAAGFEFLGFRYFADPRRGTIRKEVRGKSVRRFRETIRSLTPRQTSQRKPRQRKLTLAKLSRNGRVQRMMKRLETYLLGWHGYFGGVWSYDSYWDAQDRFIRQRVRLAITGRVGSGWWTATLHNTLLQQLGLPSLRGLGVGVQRAPWTLRPGRAELVESRMRENRTYGSGRKGAG